MRNYKRELLGISIFLIVGALYFTACDDHVNSVYEDLTGPYTQLKMIEEASNTTVTVNRGDTQGLDSYFAFDVSNINPNGILREGLVEGWCLEWNKTIAQDNDVHSEVKMYNTYGNNTWKPANYLMNIKDKLQDEDPDITYREIQVALWSLIETPSFDLDQVLEDNKIPPRLMNGEHPAFDVDKVKEIVTRVRKEVSEFTYKPGSGYLVFARTDESEQNGGIVAGNETAWAVETMEGDVNSALSTCFSDIQGLSSNRWGWTNGAYAESSEEVVLDVYAGAGQCDLDRGEFVGTFTFTYENGVMDYTIEMTEESDFTNDLFKLAELHIYAGSDILPQGQNGYTVAPGQLGFGIEFDEDTTEYSGSIEGLQGDIYVAVHAVVFGFGPGL
jgi:hypothetical protein